MAVLTRPPTAAPAAPACSRDVVLGSLERVDSYPVLSDSAIRAAALANAPNTSTAEVAGVVRRDAVLTAAVLRVANTWKYRGRAEIGDINQAVLRIGLKECANLICAVGMVGVYDRHPAPVRKRCDVLLRHSLFVAHIAAGLKKAGGVETGGMEFTAGLLHDIGRIVVCVKVPEVAAAADPLDFCEDEETLATERRVLGIDHCAIGYQFALRNALPEPLVRVILNHHRPAEEKLQPLLVALLAAADALANHAQHEHKLASFVPARSPAFAALSACLDPDVRPKVRAAVRDIVVRALRDTRTMLKAFAPAAGA